MPRSGFATAVATSWPPRDWPDCRLGAVDRQLVADHLVDGDALGRKDQGHGLVQLVLIVNVALQPDRSVQVADGDLVAHQLTALGQVIANPLRGFLVGVVRPNHRRHQADRHGDQRNHEELSHLTLLRIVFLR